MFNIMCIKKLCENSACCRVFLSAIIWLLVVFVLFVAILLFSNSLSCNLSDAVNNESLIISFFGILATFLVVDNYSRIKDFEKKHEDIKKKSEDLEKDYEKNRSEMIAFMELVCKSFLNDALNEKTRTEAEIKEAENKTIYTRTGADKINEAENKAIYFAITSMYFNLKGSKTDDVSEYTKILDAIKNNSGFVLKADAYLQVSLEYLNEIEKMLDDESKKGKIKEYIEWITKRKDK